MESYRWWAVSLGAAGERGQQGKGELRGFASGGGGTIERANCAKERLQITSSFLSDESLASAYPSVRSIKPNLLQRESLLKDMAVRHNRGRVAAYLLYRNGFKDLFVPCANTLVPERNGRVNR